VIVRFSAVLTALVVALFAGCASSSPPPPQPTARPFDDVRRVAVVVSGDSHFAVVDHSAEPGRTFDEVLKWNWSMPYLKPIADLVHLGINWLVGVDRASDTKSAVLDVSPRAVVAEALVRRLETSTAFEDVRVLEHEPVGDERRRLDAIVRVSVPEWGLVRVREGEPDLLSGFVDVQAQMVIRGAGVVVWERHEDVTEPDRLPLETFTRDRRFTRDHLMDALERAGHQLASEILYARSAGR
jgi:hypothetical protein